MSRDTAWLADRLHGEGPPIVIDGGMGTELQRLGAPMDGKVWSARAVLTHPEVVRSAHESFIEAGAEVIIANTFAAARHMLEPGGLGEQVGEINRRAVALAFEARDRVATAAVAVAGSICEWAPTGDPSWRSPEAVRRSSQEQASLLAEAGVDLIAIEMCQKIDLATAAVEAALEVGLPVWIGSSARTHREAAGMSVFDYPEIAFEPLVERLSCYPAMMMNIMHTPVPDVDGAVEILRRHWDGPIGIYPESGYFTMPDWHFVDIIEPEALADAARGWVRDGARLVGGCCGLGPEHVVALRRAFA